MMHNDDTNYNAKQSPKTPIINGHTVEQQLDDLCQQIHLLTTAQLLAPPPIPPKCIHIETKTTQRRDSP